MAKNKKLKKYKAPNAKFLVVVDPWPAGQAGHPRFIDNVAAWFEFMLRDDHPGETVRTVYTQGTHHNIIVELSESVDIQPYIGTHAHRRFLKPSHAATEAVSYIYEYDYETQNDPTRRSWTARYPSSYDISIFPFKANYPIPTPAPLPSIHVNYAKRPPVVAPPAIVFPQEPPNDVSKMRSGTPSPSLLCKEDEEIKPVVKKRDPYEEDDDATRLLRAVSLDLVPKQEQNSRSNTVDGFVKEEPISHVIPRGNSFGPSNVIDDFLASIPVKKEEPMNHIYRQSAFIKEEPFDSHDSEYRPSEELLAAFADLPTEMFNPSSAIAFPGPAKIEREEPGSINHRHRLPVSTDHALLGIMNLNRSHQERSATLATEAAENNHGLRSESAEIRIKPEPKDESLPAPLLERTRDPRRDRDRSMTLPSNDRGVVSATRPIIKSEPQDDYRIPSLSRTPDPRLIGSQMQEKREVKEVARGGVQLPASVATAQVRDSRLGEDRPTTQAQQAVHVKSEPREDYVVPPPPVVRDPRLLRREQGGHFKRVVDNDSNEMIRMKRLKLEDWG